MSIPEFDKLCLNEDKTNGTTQSDKTNQNTEVLRICFNGYAVIEVDRKSCLKNPCISKPYQIPALMIMKKITLE